MSRFQLTTAQVSELEFPKARHRRTFERSVEVRQSLDALLDATWIYEQAMRA